MKKIILALLISISLLCLSSCRREEAPNTITINGEIYRTGFYENFFTLSQNQFAGDLIGNSSKVWDELSIISNGRKGYEISYAQFEMFFFLIGNWQYYLYVKDRQFDEATQYYQEIDHFDCYWARVSKETGEYLSVFTVEATNMFAEKIHIINDSSIDDGEIIEISSLDHYYVFYKISKDGLFTSLRANLSFINGYFL